MSQSPELRRILGFDAAERLRLADAIVCDLLMPEMTGWSSTSVSPPSTPTWRGAWSS